MPSACNQPQNVRPRLLPARCAKRHIFKRGNVTGEAVIVEEVDKLDLGRVFMGRGQIGRAVVDEHNRFAATFPQVSDSRTLWA